MAEKVQVNVLLPDKLNQRLRVVAEVDGDRLSSAVEKAVAEYIDARKTDPGWQEAHQEWVKEQKAKLKAL